MSVATLLDLASLGILIVGGFDVLQKDSVWTRLWWRTRLLWRLAAGRSVRIWWVLWWLLGTGVALLRGKPAPPRHEPQLKHVDKRDAATWKTRHRSYEATPAEISAIWESFDDLESRVTKTEVDSAKALTEALDREHSETQRRGRRSFVYIFAAALLQAFVLIVLRH